MLWWLLNVEENMKMNSETRWSLIKIKCIKHCLCDVCNLLAKQICCDYLRLNSCFGSWEKKAEYFHFLQEKKVFQRFRKNPQSSVYRGEAACQQSVFQPLPFSLQEMKRQFSTKPPSSVTFQHSNKGLKPLWKGRWIQRNTRINPQSHKIKELACSNPEFRHQYVWRRSNYVHPRNDMEDKIILLNHLHCYKL